MGMSKPKLICVPGLMCSAALFAPQREGLADIADVWVPEPTKDATLEGMAQRILRAAPERFALAGLSMGGYVAFEILRQAPHRVERLALLDSNARADLPDKVGIRYLLIGMGYALGARAVQAALMNMLIHKDRLADRALVDQVLAMADSIGHATFARQQAAIIARPDNRPFLAEIKCPTTIIVGAEDALTPVKVAQEMQKGIAGSTLHVIPECGHLATLERPEAVNAILRDWLLAPST